MGKGTWPGSSAGDGNPLEPETQLCRALSGAVASGVEGCGLDCLTANSVRNQPIGDPPRPGSPLWRCGRSQVVFTEESDSSPPDWGSVSEACEIGGLGTLAAALRDGSSVRARCRVVAAAEVRLDRSVTNSGRALGASRLRGPAASCGSFRACRTVTWLILPVVICLSQRLSHACLSINNSVL